MAIEIVDIPIKNGDFPVRYVSLPEGIYRVYIYTYIYICIIYISMYIQMLLSQCHSIGKGMVILCMNAAAGCATSSVRFVAVPAMSDLELNGAIHSKPPKEIMNFIEISWYKAMLSSVSSRFSVRSFHSSRLRRRQTHGFVAGFL